MNRPIVYVLALVAAIGSWFVFQNMESSDYDPRSRSLQDRTVSRHVTESPREHRASGGSSGVGPSRNFAGQVTPQRVEMEAKTPDTIRIASMNLLPLDAAKAGKLRVMAMLSAMVRHFDVVAIQGVKSNDAGLLPRWVDQINDGTWQYDYAIGPRVGRQEQQQFAFLYDRKTVDIDRYQLYTVDDPENVLEFEPFVGCFRARGPVPHEAFTFSVVNVLIPALNAHREAKVMGQVFRRIRNDGRNEDDVLLVGDFHTSSYALRESIKIGDLVVHVVGSQPTSTLGDQQCANILFSRQASLEFTGRSGVFDFMRAFNLSLDQALEVSSQMPIWSEFSILEGGELGRVAQSARNTPYYYRNCDKGNNYRCER